MRNPNDPTTVQKKFLDRFRENPNLPDDQWPSAHLLSEWMQQPRFVRALKRTREACRFRSDLELSSASALAALELREEVQKHTAVSEQRQLTRQHQLIQVLRVAHLRAQSTKEPPAPPTPYQMKMAALLQHMKGRPQEQTVGEFCESLAQLLEGRPDATNWLELCPSPWGRGGGGGA